MRFDYGRIILILGLSTVIRGRPYSEDCNIECNHFDDNSTYERCLVACTKRARKAAAIQEQTYYPAPPINVSIQTDVIVEDGKFLETTVKWDYIPDAERTGFYLRYSAVGAKCQADFPGYFVSDIRPNARMHMIPLLFNNRPLIINHDCQYKLEMHSKPYPYGESLYKVTKMHKVPACIGQYCACEDGAVPPPEDLKAEHIVGGAKVTWKFPSKPGRTYTFYLTLHERFYPPIAFKDPKAFRFRIVDEAEHSVVSKQNQTNFTTIFPFGLKPNEEYKVTIFAEDDHYCHNEDTPVIFMTKENPLLTTQSEDIVVPTSSNNISEMLDTFVKTAEDEDKKDKNQKNEEILPEASKIPLFENVNTTPVLSHEIEEFTAPTVVTSPVMESTEASPTVFSTALFTISQDTLILLLIALTLFSPLCTMSIVLCLKRRSLNKKKLGRFRPSWTLTHSRHSILETNILYRRPIEFRTPLKEEDWQIGRDDISVGSVIGEGAFGLVCKGTIRGPKGMPVRVAIKQLKSNAVDEEKKEFQREMEIMKQVGRHPNIVTMYGYNTDSAYQCMVMEYVPFGDLKHYLQNLRKQLSLAVTTLKTSLRMDDVICHPAIPPSMNSSFISTMDEPMELQYQLDPTELQSFACQIAAGMAHLESLGITHRDLAARNILVGENKQLKISDFGMSRQGVYVKMSKGVIPLRWLSIEAVQDNVYSTKSDVWAYGIVLWEICTLGGFPYSTISDKDLLSHLLDGNRLEKPMSCSDEIYDIMMACWRTNPSERPSFACVADQLGDIKSPYVEFIPHATHLPPQGPF